MMLQGVLQREASHPPLGEGGVMTQMAFKNKQCHCAACRAKKVITKYTIMTETGKILFKLTQEEII